MEYNTQLQPLQCAIYKDGSRNAETMMQSENTYLIGRNVASSGTSVHM